MRKVFKVLIGCMLTLSGITAFAAEGCSTTMVMEAQGWNNVPNLPKVSAEFLALTAPSNQSLASFYKSPENGTQINDSVCYTGVPIAVNIVDENYQILGFYLSKKSYSSNQPVTVVFPQDFYEVRVIK